MFTNKFDIFRTENSFAFTYQRKLLEYNPQNSYTFKTSNICHTENQMQANVSWSSR